MPNMSSKVLGSPEESFLDATPACASRGPSFGLHLSNRDAGAVGEHARRDVHCGKFLEQ
jgi:hypothetical protein